MIQGMGLISGIDTRSLIDQLVAVERQPIVTLEREQSAARATISMLGSIKSKMSDLSTLLEDSFEQITKVLSNIASTTDEDDITVEASGEAVPGSFSVGVTQLAKFEKDRSAAFTDSLAEVTEGTLTIEVFDGDGPVDITIDAGDDLATVRDKINSADAGVSATIINTGTESYLTITSNTSGHEIGGTASDSIIITESYTGGSGQALGLAETQTAQNALLTIDGLAVERSSNSFSDAVDGVTLNLRQVTTTNVDIVVAPDPDAVMEHLQEFIDSYNGVVDALKTLKDEHKQLERMGLGDLTRDILNAGQSLSGNYTTMSIVGIEFKSQDGKLTVDDEKLKEALEIDPRAVAQLFTNGTDGIAGILQNTLERYTDRNGLLENSTDTLNNRIDSLDDQIVRKERRVEAYEAGLVRQFTAMEQVMAQMNQISGTFAGFVPMGFGG